MIRKVFLCYYCECIYADEPVTSCDCNVGAPPKWIEGVATFPAKLGTNNQKTLEQKWLGQTVSCCLRDMASGNKLGFHRGTVTRVSISKEALFVGIPGLGINGQSDEWWVLIGDAEII